MAKRKTRPPRKTHIDVELRQARQFMIARRWQEAYNIVQPLAHRYPTRPDVWVMLGDVAAQLHDLPGIWEASDHLIQLEPDNPDHGFNLVMACMANTLPFSALHYTKQFLQTWPNHKDAGEIRDIHDQVQEACDAILATDPVAGEASADDLMLYEIAQMAFACGDFARGEKVTQQAIERLPRAVAPLNNLTLAYAVNGELDKAIETARQALQRDPDNMHALANLVQCLVRTGQREAAEETARQMRALPPPDPSLYVKQIEALSYLGDDAAVCEVFDEVEASIQDVNMPLFCHLGAVAFARQGDKKRAEQLWRRALRLDRGFEIARHNLNDLKKPAGKRNGAWPFPFQQWVPQRWIETVYRATVKGKHSDAALKREYTRLLEKNPYLAAVLPILLERGDPDGRKFAVMMAAQAELPLLRDFALSANGTDQDRMDAAMHAVEFGLLPRGKPVPMFAEGRQTELLLMAYEISGEPEPLRMPRQAHALLAQGFDAMNKGHFADAERVLRDALEIAPDNPSLLNNLAAALFAQRKHDEGNALIRRMAELHPDYHFARCGMARLCVEADRLDEAQEWLDPIMSRERFHISEFSALCIAQIELALAEGKPEGAQSWIQFWEQIDPENPNLPTFQRLVKRGKRR
jgi:tetratricopeptide (TPR) repeat protein